jgi:hypothetical protein
MGVQCQLDKVQPCMAQYNMKMCINTQGWACSVTDMQGCPAGLLLGCSRCLPV